MRLCLAAALFACACSDDGATGLDGRWVATWTCSDGCAVYPRALIGSTSLEVAGPGILWDSEPPSAMTGARNADCLTIPDGAPLPAPQDLGWSVYDLRLCVDVGSDALSADLHAITHAGETQTRWHLSGARE